MKKIVLFIFLVLGIASSSFAYDCDDINELTDYGIVGSSSFIYGNNSEINGNDISGSGNTPTPTGTVSTVSLDFPPIDPATFPTFTANTDRTDPDTVTAGTYNTIDIDKNNHTTVFSGGDYYIKKLDLKKGNIQLAPGRYFIEEFAMNNDNKLIINPSGKVEIYIKTSLTGGNQLELNAEGAVENLTIYLYDGANMNIGNGDNGNKATLTFNGVIYSPYDTTTITFNNNNNIQGAILSDGEISVGTNTEFNYSTDVQNAVIGSFGCEPTPPASPVANYRMDSCSWDGTSNEVIDQTGNHNGTSHNGTTTDSEGKICRSGYFDGTDDYISIPSSDDFEKQSFTLSAWVRPEGGSSTNRNYIITKGTGNWGSYLSYGMFYDKSQDKFGCYIGDAGETVENNTYISDTAITPNGDFFHFVCRYDGKTLRMYQNGINVGNYGIDKTISYPTSESWYKKLDIGRYHREGTERYFKGYIDEVLIFDKAISETQIQDIYTNQNAEKNWDDSARTCNDKCLDFSVEYRFDDICQWTGVEYEVAEDSGNDLNGTIVNPPLLATKGVICSGAEFNTEGYESKKDDQYIVVDDTNLLDDTQVLTAMAWINPSMLEQDNGTNARGIFSKRKDPSSENSFGVFFRGSKQEGSFLNEMIDEDGDGVKDKAWLYVDIAGTNDRFHTNGYIYKDRWTHVAVVFDGTLAENERTKVYINGILDKTSKETSTSIPDNDSNFYIGNLYYGTDQLKVFKGKMDEIKIIKEALDSSTISDIFSKESVGMDYLGRVRSCTCTSKAGNIDIWQNCPDDPNDANSRLYTRTTDLNQTIYIPFLNLTKDGYESFNGDLNISILLDIDDTNESIILEEVEDLSIDPNTQKCYSYKYEPSKATRKAKFTASVQNDDTNQSYSVSSDEFSIRPLTFNWNPSFGSLYSKAGTNKEIYTIQLNSINTSSGGGYDGNATIIKQGDALLSDTSLVCSTTSTSYDINTSEVIEFSSDTNTNLVDINVSDINEVGVWDLNITLIDSNWTEVDQSNDCIQGSGSNTLQDGKVGCNIETNASLELKVYPHHFDINTSKAISHPIGGSDSYLYYGQGRDDNLSENYIELDINITAKSESNATTLNYDGECFAPDNTDLNISLEFEEKPSSEYLTMRYLFDDSQNTSGGSLSLDDKKFTIENIVDKNTTYNDGLSENELKFIFDVNQTAIKADNNNTKKPINPMKISTSQNKITLDINATMSDDVNVEGSLDNADSTMQLDNNITYYFGRLTPIDAQTTDNNVSVTFYIDVYCKDCNSSELTKFNLNSSPKSVKYPANWYINTNEDNLEINIDNNSEVSFSIPLSFADGKGEITASKINNNFYGKAKVDIDLKDSDQTFIYYNPYSDTNITRFYIDFLKEPEGDTPGDVIDNQGKDSDSGRRLRW